MTPSQASLTGAFWLVKTEPSTYDWDSLARDGHGLWDGVRNAQATQYLKAMRPGDPVLIYHSGREPAAIGAARVVAEPIADVTDPKGRSVAVALEPVAPLARPVALSAMRAEPRLSGLVLLRQSRLSVVPLTSNEWQIILDLGGGLA